MSRNRCENSTKQLQNDISVTYTLFLYQEELRRRDARHLKLSRTKIHLTDKLISTTVRNITECTNEDLRALSRGLDFKKQLKHQIQRIKTLQQLGIKNPNPNSLSTTL